MIQTTAFSSADTTPQFQLEWTVRLPFSVLTNAEGLCFSDGWIVSSLEEGETTGKMEGVRGSPLQSISITESPEECRGLCQHGLVQESEEPCSMWEWEVATKTCSLFRSGTRLSRPDDLPLGFSILSKMLTGKGEESDLKLIGAAGVRMLEKSLVAMKTIVGTRFCSNLALARNVETQRSKVQSKASCDIPEHRDFPWMTRSDMLVPTRPTTKLRIKPFPPDAGVCSTPHPPKVTPGCKTTTDWFMFWMVRATSHFSMLSMYSLEDVEEFKQLAAGFDSRTPYLEAVTDRTKDIVECQQLCQNTANCNVFTFYIDYRSDANCVLKGKVLRQDMFEHPVAITGSKTEKTALALRGMKFGYAMKHRTTVGSGADPEDFDPYHLLTRTAQLDILARQMCERFSYEGWAVIDYTSRQVYAVPANGAVEAYSPMSNYISCRKVLNPVGD
ncbi:hypothetical protein Esti_003087 [Eimeria stiedai]